MTTTASEIHEIIHTGRLTIGLICSHGGHLTEMLQLMDAFDGHDVFFLSYDAPTTSQLKRAYLVPNMARNPVEFAKNLFRVHRIFKKERPDLLISTGAEIALPAAVIARLLGIPFLYIECGAQVFCPSMTGRIMYWLADRFLVQWPELLDKYGGRARFRGSLIDKDTAVHSDRSHEKYPRVSLVQPAFSGGFSSKQPPVGLAYLASVLQKSGAQVRVIDANAEGLTNEELVAVLQQQRPDIIGVTVTTPLVPTAIDLANRIHETDFGKRPLLIAGGPHATVLPEDLLQEKGFDVVIRGAGEEAVKEIIECFKHHENPVDLKGVSHRLGGVVIHNPDRDNCTDLESLPFPDWSLFPLRLYSSPVRRNEFSLPILTSRGCPHKCTFCYKGVFGKEFRMRSPNSVLAEWEHLVKRYRVEEVAVIDDVFTENARRAKEICRLLVDRGLNHIPWSTTNGIRVTNVTPELMSALKNAGCYRVYFGVESGVQRVIDSIGKNISLEQVKYAVRVAKEVGLEVGLYFMLGNLGETAEDMEQTIRCAIELDPDLVQFTIATPYPGTEMYRRVTSEGRLLVNTWAEFASYEGLIFECEGVIPEVVNRKHREALRRFYLRPRFILRQTRQLTSWSGVRRALRSSHALLGLLLRQEKRQSS